MRKSSRRVFSRAAAYASCDASRSKSVAGTLRCCYLLRVWWHIGRSILNLVALNQISGLADGSPHLLLLVLSIAMDRVVWRVMLHSVLEVSRHHPHGNSRAVSADDPLARNVNGTWRVQSSEHAILLGRINALFYDKLLLYNSFLHLLVTKRDYPASQSVGMVLCL